MLHGQIAHGADQFTTLSQRDWGERQRQCGQHNDRSDATQKDQTTHGALLRAEDTWPLTDEHSTIPYLDQQELGAQL
jgi:hypothetical protein